MLSYFSKMLCNLSRAPWDSGWYALDLNCFIIKACLRNYNKLDPLQAGAARIVTGLPIFASSILIYKELTGNHWQKEKKRTKW
jgi:hypothetical protein